MTFLNTSYPLAPERSFDVECYRLATLFLDELPHATEDNRRDLALTIQLAIEDWLEDQDTSAAAAYGDYIDRKIDERRIEGRP